MADVVFCIKPGRLENIPLQEQFSAKDLVENLNTTQDTKAFVSDNVQDLLSLVLKKMKKQDVIVMMSNGAFGGIQSLLKGQSSKNS